MSATMKGLLKGLRYISQIFENSDEDDEPEMQIGNPTDVKHVAHIGWDGPTVNSPSWMNDFREPNESSSAPLNFPRESNENQDVSNKDGPEQTAPRRYSPMDAPSPPEDQKKTRRRRHSAGGAVNTTGRDLINGLKPRRHQSSLGVESATTDSNASPPPSIPRKSRTKKSKESSLVGAGDGSSKSGGGSSKSGGGSSNGPSKSRFKTNKNSESKPKENVCPSSALKELGLDEKEEQGVGLA